MSKKNDLPAMPFYPGDWLKCPEVRSLPLDYRALWFDLLCFMWESTERGVMVKPNGKPYTNNEIIRMVGLDNQNSEIWLTSLLENEVCSKRESDGAIFSRRMIRDEQIRLKRKESGSKGGNPILINNNLVNQQDNQKVIRITEDEDEDENENKDVIKNEPVNEKRRSTGGEKKEFDFIDQILNIWITDFKKARGFDYEVVNKGKDRAALGKLITLVKRKNLNQTSEETLVSFDTFFKSCLNISEKFIFENITPALILSQLNKIKTILSNGKAKQFNQAQQFNDFDWSVFNR